MKGKKGKKLKIVIDMGITIDRRTQRVVDKHFKTKFVATWILVVAKEVGDRFHHKFQASL
jgi:hypothetical protein